MLPHDTRKGSRLQDSNEQLGHAMDVMPARGKETQEFMNATDRVLQRCAAVEFYVRQNAKFAWTTPFVPDPFFRARQFESLSEICDNDTALIVDSLFGHDPVNSKRAIAQLLQHLSGVGVTHVPRVEFPTPAKPAQKIESKARGGAANTTADGVTVKDATKPGRKSSKAAAAVPEMRRPTSGLRSMEELKITDADRPGTLAEVQGLLRQELTDSQQKHDALCSLAAIVAKCRRCNELAATRKQTVFGVGDPNARIMFIGEAPGADEDATGEPFVGEAGQLLNKIVAACKLRREDIYICNVLRCRPPGNRNPLPQEVSNCREFLDAQIRIVQPEYIICWGAVAAQNLLNETRPVGKLRRQFFTHNGAKVMCTYHPSYLLRNPSAKKEVWDDMKFFMLELGIELQ